MLETCTFVCYHKTKNKKRKGLAMRKRKNSITAAICMVLICAMTAGCTATVPTSGQNDSPATTLTTTPPSTSTTAPTTPATTPPTTGSTQPTDPTIRYTVTVEKKDETHGIENATLIFVCNERGDLLEYWTDSLKFLYTYDSQGRILSENAYYLSGELVEQTNYTYDADGRLIQMDGFDYSSAGVNIPYVVQYCYDSNGNLIEEQLYQSGELSGGHIYDANGNLTEKYWAGDVQHEWYTYTAEGKLQSVYTELYGAPYSGCDYFYDENGNLIREERFIIYSDKRKEWANTYTYDENGRCIRYDMGGNWNEQSYQTYTYDAAGNMISCEYPSYDGRMTGHFWTYDEAGRMISYKFNSQQGPPSYIWDYDAKGVIYKLARTMPGADLIYSFHYTWPEAELPQQFLEEIASRIAKFTGASVYTPERYAWIYQ